MDISIIYLSECLYYRHFLSRPVQVEATAKEQNGNASHPRPPTEPTEPKRQSLGSLSDDPTASAAASTEEQTARARTLSARSFDPLPELPKLDLAEKLSSADDKEDNEEEAPYSYARVPKGGDVPQSDSSDEDGNDSPNREISPPAIPPYGKVTASDKGKQAPLDDMMGEYAEVTGEGRRDRSVTAPVDPSEVGRVRDNRAFTESAAHLPLPAIPKGPRPTLEEDNAMYDSIPETMAGVQARPAIVKRERLYESVDEMANDAEDMYESVPEELKPDSPVVVSPLILSPSSPELPPLPTSPRHPLDSPTTGPPTNQNLGLELKVDESSKKKKADKKALEKTLSTSDQAEKKRTFSIFNRKKAISVSEGVAKTKKKPEKELQSPKPHQGEPLPDIPPQLSPSLPLAHPKTPLPVPPNDDEEEDMYDKPEISLPKTSDSETTAANVRTTQDAKARSKTLPATGRSSGVNSFKFSQNLPLPELPENFGQGLVTVTHTRHLEDSSEVTEPYDIVHISPPPIDETEEPNYDTVRPDLILHVNPSLEVRGDPDPGYDRVGIKLDGAEESNALSDEDRGSERSTSPGGAGEIVVTEIPSPELDDSVAGPIPDHDEVGYARVPEMHRMRKRAMSANQGAMKKPNSEKKMSTDDTGVLKRATSPDEVYAIIDMAAKKRNRKKKSEDLGVTERDIENSSPVPPPLPPMGDLGDLSEFDQPPLPERLDEANHLMVEVENDSGYSKVLKVGPTLGADPPYAKVKSKVEHPYAELDIGGSAKPDLTNSSNPSSPIENEASSNDMITVPATKDNTDAADNDENHMYDTLSPPKSPTEVSVVIGTPEEEEDVSQNTYDTLTDTNAESRDVDLEEEGPYEEIDEETRQNLQKLHPKPV